MTIDSCEFVYCVAEPSTGKTFNGDYLEIIHGFHHVDGDLPLRTMHKPEMRHVVGKMIEGAKLYPERMEFLKSHSSEDMEGLEEYWGPYFQTNVDAALEAAKSNDKVVITFADGNRISRDYVMDKLREGGAINVTMLYLTIDENKKLEDLYHRMIRQLEACGSSLEDYCKMRGWEGGGEGGDEKVPMDAFKEIVLRPGELGDVKGFEDPPPCAKIVDVTKRDVSTMDKIDETLGLQRTGDDSYEEIVKKVRERDFRRDEETPYRFDVWPEIEKDVMEALAEAETEEERVQIKRRASSLISLEMKTPVGRASLLTTLLSEEVDKDASAVSSLTDSTKLRNKRRSTLIRTGRVE